MLIHDEIRMLREILRKLKEVDAVEEYEVGTYWANGRTVDLTPGEMDLLDRC